MLVTIRVLLRSNRKRIEPQGRSTLYAHGDVNACMHPVKNMKIL